MAPRALRLSGRGHRVQGVSLSRVEEPSCFVQLGWSPAGVRAGGRDFAQLLDLGLWRSNWIPRPGHAGVLGEGHCPVITSRPAPQTPRFPSTLPPGLGRFPGRPFQYQLSLNAGAVAAITAQMPTPGGLCPSTGYGVRGGGGGRRWARSDMCCFSFIHPTRLS